jgi:hypothetical protein
MIGFAVLAFAAMNNSALGGTLRKIWNFNISAVPGVESRGTPLGVFAIGFSRDGQQIAALVGRSHREDWVLVLDSQAPATHFSILSVNPQVYDHEPGSDKRIEWSPSGEHIILSDTVIRLSSGASCSLPPRAWIPGYRFSGNGRVVGDLGLRRIQFFDLDCHAADGWDIPDGEFLETYDVSAERNLIALTQKKVVRSVVTKVSRTIIDTKTRRTVLELPSWHQTTALVDGASVVNPQFADSGEAFCWMRGDLWHRIVGCSAVATGRVLATTQSWSYPEIRTALRAPRVVISDYSKKLDWIDFFWYPGSPRRRVIWDFRSGQELARWKPKTQTVETGTVFRTLPYRFDISPDGEYIVEAGSGVVGLYRIER